jgi:two-component system, LytTR family, response regulator AlgR
MTLMVNMQSPLQVLVVDDEPLARSRMATLLGDCTQPLAVCSQQVANAVQAMEALQHQRFDALLLDIHMPGTDGLALARSMAIMTNPPAVIFVTAHAEHAVEAFDLAAVDYLTKPVRLERLLIALQKAQRYLQSRNASTVEEFAQDVLVIQDRNRTERVPLSDVVYFKAELKYITVRTPKHNYIFDGSLGKLEEKYGGRFMRVHRNALIAKRAVRALQKHYDPQEGEGWALRLDGVDELIFVSRRQLSAVRDMLAGA